MDQKPETIADTDDDVSSIMADDSSGLEISEHLATEASSNTTATPVRTPVEPIKAPVEPIQAPVEPIQAPVAPTKAGRLGNS